VELSEGEADITCGCGSYGQGSFPLPKLFSEAPSPAYSCAAWPSEDTLELMARLVETPFTYFLTVKFTPGEAELKFKANVGFGPKEFPGITGRLDHCL